jgi:hypothetical protein
MKSQAHKKSGDQQNPQVRGFFYGSNQGSTEFSGVVGSLYLCDDQFLKFKGVLGTESNNYAEFMALRCLLKCALEKNI